MLEEILENEVKWGKVVREEVVGLKCGFGKVVVYTDQTKHPDIRVFKSGKILLEEESSIGQHTKYVDETWTVIQGKLECNGKTYFPGQTVRFTAEEERYCRNLYEGNSVIRFIQR